MERRLRDLAEAQRPTPTIQQLQQAARQTPEPLLNPASRDPIDVVFNNASLRDILNSMGMSAGINVTYERDYQDRSYTIQLRGVTFEQALNQILAANQLFYKVINERTIMVIPDNAQKRALYEEQVIRTFFVSHADATELAQILNGIIRIPGARRGAADRREQDQQHDHGARQRQHRRDHRAHHRAERQPEGGSHHRRADPRGEPHAGQAVRHRPQPVHTSTPCSRPKPTRARRDADAPVPPFNLNTITRGISTADFYLSVPSADRPVPGDAIRRRG